MFLDGGDSEAEEQVVFERAVRSINTLVYDCKVPMRMFDFRDASGKVRCSTNNVLCGAELEKTFYWQYFVKTAEIVRAIFRRMVHVTLLWVVVSAYCDSIHSAIFQVAPCASFRTLLHFWNGRWRGSLCSFWWKVYMCRFFTNTVEKAPIRVESLSCGNIHECCRRWFVVSLPNSTWQIKKLTTNQIHV